MNFQIKCRVTAKVLFECEADSLKLAVEKAVSVSADLDGADLDGANLVRADLVRADLTNIKEDFFKRLKLAVREAVGLYKALLDGRINGSAYTGDCACFVGTIANLRGVAPIDLKDLIGLGMDANSATEKWFVAINEGDSPENNKVAAITKTWLEEFLTENEIKIPVRRIVWE